MRRKNCKRIKHIPALMLAAVLLVQQPFGSVGPVQAEKADTGEGLDYAGTGDATQISDPRIVDTISGSVSTWDCVWFGRYWQDTDSDGDGNVTDNDNKDPIKWRVLSFNTRTGDALLLSDRILDSFEYNTDNAFTTWENSTLRSFLNSYGTDHSETGFFNNAFSTKERNAITTTRVTVEKDIERNIDGGNPVNDKVFCLSSGQVRTRKFGFIKNEPTAAIPSATDKDATREAVVTDYVYNRYLRLTRGEGEVIYVKDNNGRHFWWCRSSTLSSGGSRQDYIASSVQDEGQSYMYGAQCTLGSGGVRPALWLNLSNNVGLWSNAGTVSSDGTKNETAPPDDDVSLPEKPVISDASLTRKFTTWDCVWFGRYWQDSDSNGDGKVTKEDRKDRILWRVLDIDESGNALLLADRLLDRSIYSEEFSDITWENSVLRSYLNCYNGSMNTDGVDHSSDGFLKNAFSEDEQAAITNGTVPNPNNPVYENSGGNATTDRIFCLSIQEATTEDYGFLENEFLYPDPSGTTQKRYRTDLDLTRAAYETRYSGDSVDPQDWWLRSTCLPAPGYTNATFVQGGSSDYEGSVNALGRLLGSGTGSVRPALRINLKNHPDEWLYAGKVDSEGKQDLVIPVDGVSLYSPVSLYKGKTTWITPKFVPSNASNQKVTWSISPETVASINQNGLVTGISAGNATVKVTTEDGGFTATCVVNVTEKQVVLPGKPVTSDGISTWDCVYFGNYWQEDTNGDGHCYSKDTEKDGTTYRADARQKIKWRVLDIDSGGKALLLSDKCLDTMDYIRTQGLADVTWSNSRMRSFLNSYDESVNRDSKDFSFDGFLNNAFNAAEIKAITNSEVLNPDNDVFGTSGGDATVDKVFCLSLEEARTAGYGFINNVYTKKLNPTLEKNHRTEDDNTRRTVITKYVEDSDLFTNLNPDDPYNSWWLRTPGVNEVCASTTGSRGSVSALGMFMYDYSICVRPALRIDLKTYSDVWESAGKVSSDPPEPDPTEDTKVTGVSLPKELSLWEGETKTLTPVIEPSDATDQTVTWESSDDTVASVDPNGKVTGLKAGNAVIKATTNDGGFTAECKVTVSIYISTIKKPSTRNGVTTWDCVYFGNYWQNTDSDAEDSHEDGRVDRNDVKDPIKWRVLDIDGEGNALLLSDTLLDILEYNGTDESITWEESTLRAFLNSDEGYLKDGFITNAFSAEEIDAIFVSTLENEDNPVWGADGGNETRDAVFCLSLSEAMTAKYGFIKNRFSAPGSSSKQYLTGADPSRSAVATSFIEDKEGYTGYIAGSNADWWLRSPGYIRSYASRVYGGGEVNASSLSVTNRRVCVRPAIRINLKEHESLWEYAGIVKSDPAEEDDPEEPEEPEDEIVLEADEEDRELEMIPGEVRRLTTSKTGRYIYGIRWEVTSDPLKCVTVKNGVVTARKTGTAIVKASYGPCEPIIYNITVDGNSPAVAVGEEGSKISSKKKVTLVCDKTKTINVSLPPLLAGRTVTPGVLKGGVCTVKEVGRNAKGNKVSFAITALDAGATYVIWNVTDRAGNITQAYTKVIVKKPVTSLVIDHTQPLKLNVGEGKRLVVNTTLGNTDYRSLTFKVSGKGVKVSRSGYVTATAPGAYATVTVKGGGFSKTLDVEVHSADNKYMTVGNPLKEIKAPAVSKGKSKKLTFLLASPKRKGDRPAVTWDIQGKHDGIKIDGNVVTVDPSVTPGSYIVTADGEGFNSAYSELIVK